MSEKPYTLESDQKATLVMIGTSDMLLWGDLITKEHLRLSGFLTTMAEAFVPIHDAKILFLAPTEQNAPTVRSVIYVKLEEILLFFSMNEAVSFPEESDVRKYEPIEIIIASFQIEASIIKSPVATLENMLLVSKDAYMTLYKATVRQVAKPWLGSFTADMIQIRQDRMSVTQV